MLKLVGCRVLKRWSIIVWRLHSFTKISVSIGLFSTSKFISASHLELVGGGGEDKFSFPTIRHVLSIIFVLFHQ